MNPSVVHGELTISGVTVLATSRHGGVSIAPFDSLNLGSHVGDDEHAVDINLDRVRSASSAQRLAIMQPEHGAVVHVATHEGLMPAGDGLVTATPGLGIVTLSADCVPVALVERNAQRVGVFHAGWKGVLADVATATVHAMTSLGANVHDLVAVIGPHICPDCYEVSQDRVAMFAAHSAEAVADSRHLDLGAGVAAQLVACGVEVQHIPGCTFENPDLFSYRRDAITGRNGLVVVIPS